VNIEPVLDFCIGWENREIWMLIEPSRKQARRACSPEEVRCENSDAAWQTESCCVQGTKNNSRQWLRSCSV